MVAESLTAENREKSREYSQSNIQQSENPGFHGNTPYQEIGDEEQTLAEKCCCPGIAQNLFGPGIYREAHSYSPDDQQYQDQGGF